MKSFKLALNKKKNSELWTEKKLFSIKLIALKSNGAVAIDKPQQYWIRIAHF